MNKLTEPKWAQKIKSGYSEHGKAIELVTAETEPDDLGVLMRLLERFTCLPVLPDDDADLL